MLQRTHEQEGYPVRQTAVSSAWLASDDELWSAAADEAGRLVGHVALHPPSPAAVPVWREATARSRPG